MMDAQQLSKTTTAAIMASFRSQFGYLPDAVVSLNGEPPSMANNFLYDPDLERYEGKVIISSGEMYFSLYRDEKENWLATFVPIMNKREISLRNNARAQSQARD
jgi:hypothetical protein